MSAIPATPSQAQTEATPFPVFQAINAFHLTEAIHSAIELDIFTAIGAGHTTAQALAAQCRMAGAAQNSSSAAVGSTAMTALFCSA